MTVIEILSVLRQHHVSLWVENGKLRYRAPQGRLTPEIEREVRGLKTELLAFLDTAGRLREEAAQPAIAAVDAATYPLSFSQQRMWFVQQMHPDNAAYTVHTVVRFLGPLQVEALDAALTEVINRHDALRTTFRIVDGTPLQVVGPRWSHALTVTDLRDLDRAAQEAEVQRLALTDSTQPFDLEAGPLLRVRLVRLNANEHIWIENFSHIIVDDWSMRIISREWMALYSIFKHRRPSTLPPPSIQFPHFAVWQRQVQQGAAVDRALAYWTKQLAGSLPALELATDHPMPATQSFAGAQRRYLLPTALVRRLQQWGDERNATLFMTLLTAYAITLSTYSRQTDVVIGSPIAGRTHVEAESVVGCCIGVLALRVDLSDNPTITTLLDRVRQTCLGAYAHPDPPFEELLQRLRVERDPRRHSIFQTLFALLNAPLEVKLTFDDITAVITDFHNQAVKMDFALTAIPVADGLSLLIDYGTALFEPQTIDCMIGTLITTIDAMLADPQQRVQQLTLADPTQQAQLAAWNRVPADSSPAPSVQHRVSARAAATPDAIAIQHGALTMTYRELEARANQLARTLAAHGLGPETIAAIFLPRSIDMIVAMLAVMKCGAAYVPLDPAMPTERTAFIVRDSGPVLVITADHLRAHASWGSMPVVSVNAKAMPHADGAPPFAAVTPQLRHLAYVIYTSGSTGQPKGVAIEHGALNRYVDNAIAIYGFTAADRMLEFASISFDALIEEIYPALAAGGTIVIRDEEMLASMEGFIDSLARWQISVATLPAAFWAQAVAELAALNRSFPPCLRLLILGGERVAAHSVSLWQSGVKGRAALVNSYGPTEATVIVTTWSLPAASTDRPDIIPIGKPLPHVQLHLLNREGRQVPIGAPGELCITGDSVGRGYVGRRAATALAFTPNPFGPPGSRLYHTGDLARYGTGGDLAFLGRLDQQIKIRGFRVEPGEIECVLMRHAGVREALVVAQPDAHGQDALVAYLTVHDDVPVATADQLRVFLRTHLPAYMIPSAFCVVSALPRTTGGKVDTHALAATGRPLPDAGTARVAPRSDLERSIAAIWATVLGLSEVGVFDDFYDVGGHSLLIAQLLSRVQAQCGRALSLRAFLQAPTIAGMARALGDATPQQASPDHAPALVLADEAALAPEIAAGARTWTPGRLSEIFLTGATGFLGAFLIRELVARTQATVHCLVRCTDARDGRARLRERLSRLGVWNRDVDDRLTVVPGDLRRPLFGLTAEAFRALAAPLDAIYHNGAAVDTLSPYRVLKPANVGGTHEALRLAAAGRLIPLHYISTLSVADLDDRGDVLSSASGYDQTKRVAEALIRQASTRGIPITIFRPSTIGGDSTTGACNPDDFFYRVVRGCIACGAVPDIPMSFDLAPVDFVAAQIVDRSLDAGSIGHTFHLASERPLPLHHLAAHLRAGGWVLREEPYGSWQARLAQVADHHPLAPLAPRFPAMLPDADRCVDGNARASASAAAAAGIRTIACPPPTPQVIDTYLAWLADRDLVPRAPHRAQVAVGS